MVWRILVAATAVWLTVSVAQAAAPEPVIGLPGIARLPDGRLVTLDAATQAPQPERYYHASFTPNDPDYSLQWNFSAVGSSSAWEADTISPKYGGDPSIVVAVLDTGVAFENSGSFVQAPDLAQTHFWVNRGEIARERN